MSEDPPGHQLKRIRAEAETEARALAACYARVFLGGDDGKRVLADLRKKFGLSRLVFVRNERGQIDVNGGLLRDGERRVMHEIEEALRVAAPSQTFTETSNQTNAHA